MHLSVRSSLSFFNFFLFCCCFVFVCFVLFCLFVFQLGLHCDTWTLSCDLLPSLLVARRLSCLKAYEILVPWPGIDPMSLTLEGRFLTSDPPEKSQHFLLRIYLHCCPPGRFIASDTVGHSRECFYCISWIHFPQIFSIHISEGYFHLSVPTNLWPVINISVQVFSRIGRTLLSFAARSSLLGPSTLWYWVSLG